MNNYWVANQIHFFNCMFVPDEGWNSGYIHDELSTGEPEQAGLCLFHGTHPGDSFSGRLCHLLQKQKLMIFPQTTSSDYQYLDYIIGTV